MKTILRIRGTKPEAEAETVVDVWIEKSGDAIALLGLRVGQFGGGHLIYAVGPEGSCRHPDLPPSWGFLLDKEGRVIDRTPDVESDVNQELLAACEAGLEAIVWTEKHSRVECPSVKPRLKAAIARAKE